MTGIPEPKETFVLEAKFIFNTKEEREQFRIYLMENDTAQPLTMKFSSFFSHCKKCGRPRWMGTLGYNDMPNQNIYRDRCKPAYWNSCQRYQNKGGWQPNAEMGSNYNV